VAVTVASFKSAFPEFADAPTGLVQAKLTDSAQLCPLVPWGALQDQGVSYYTAQALALSPFARKMALADKDGVTIYDDRLTLLKRMVTAGFRVV